MRHVSSGDIHLIPSQGQNLSLLSKTKHLSSLYSGGGEATAGDLQMLPHELLHGGFAI